VGPGYEQYILPLLTAGVVFVLFNVRPGIAEQETKVKLTNKQEVGMDEKPLDTASKGKLRRLASEMAGVQFTEEELAQLAPQVASLLAD
jgi:hypothetical protein